MTQWYPQVVGLASYPVEEVRNTDAWVMGQDTSGAGFHEALLKMLDDPSLSVRGNAALSLVRFGDATGRPQILELLQPATVIAPQSGKVIDTSAVGTAIHQGRHRREIAARRSDNRNSLSDHQAVYGRCLHQTGQMVSAGDADRHHRSRNGTGLGSIACIYLIGRPEDIAAVLPYERELPDIPNDVRKQAIETEKAITERARR